jgi:hypothetical protein
MVKSHLGVFYDDVADGTTNSGKDLVYHAIHMEHVRAAGWAGEVNQRGIIQDLLADVTGDKEATFGDYRSHNHAVLCVFRFAEIIVGGYC